MAGRPREHKPPPPPGANGPEASPRTRTVLCPYCGFIQQASDQCIVCHGRMDPLSRQATQNRMGPWHVRDEVNPFAPGFDETTLRSLCKRGRIHLNTIVRGPTTRQFWTLASNTPIVAALLGQCHACHGPVRAQDESCVSCGALLYPSTSRESLGLAPVQPLPGQADPDEVAAAALGVSKAFVPPPPPADPRAAAPNRALERRLKHEIASLRRRVSALTLLCLLLIVAAAAYELRDRWMPAVGLDPDRLRIAGPSDDAPPAPEQPAPAPAHTPPLSVPDPPAEDDGGGDVAAAPARSEPELILDAGLAPWESQYRRALELESAGTTESLAESLELLESILLEAEAGADPADASAAELPLLRDKINRIRARLEAERAREAVEVAAPQ